MRQVNRSSFLLKMTEEQKRANLKVIEEVLLGRRSDLKLLNADLLYSIILAFANSKLQSELLYLIEPHILSRS